MEQLIGRCGGFRRRRVLDGIVGLTMLGLAAKLGIWG
jgi:hypothetical protein